MSYIANLVNEETKRTEQCALRKQVAELLKNRRTMSILSMNQDHLVVSSVDTTIRLTSIGTNLVPNNLVS